MIRLKNKWTNEIKEFKDGKNISIELGLDIEIINQLLKGKLKSVKDWILVNDDVKDKGKQLLISKLKNDNVYYRKRISRLEKNIQDLNIDIVKLKLENSLLKENNQLLKEIIKLLNNR